MTTVQGEKIARRKLGLLQLSQELGNVSKACKIMGYSRQPFQVHGAPRLVNRLPGACAPRPNWVSGDFPYSSHNQTDYCHRSKGQGCLREFT
jgi:hypothetical protein